MSKNEAYISVSAEKAVEVVDVLIDDLECRIKSKRKEIELIKKTYEVNMLQYKLLPWYVKLFTFKPLRPDTHWEYDSIFVYQGGIGRLRRLKNSFTVLPDNSVLLDSKLLSDYDYVKNY